MRAIIRAGLVAKLDGKLVDELLDGHAEAKRNFSLGGLRLSAVEAGRFCEAAFRLLEQISSGLFTPIGKQLKTEKIAIDLANLSAASFPDSIRLHIPRALRVVYDIRSKRDAAHLADGIDPNIQDATLVISVIDWVLAELVRLYHNVTPNEAQGIVQSIVTKATPTVEDFNGFLKVLNPKLKASECCLLLLYHRDRQGASIEELNAWVQPKMRRNLRRTLDVLVHEKSYIHFDGKRYLITMSGRRAVEQSALIAVQ